MTLKIYIIDTKELSIDDLLKSPYLSKEDKLSFDKISNPKVKLEKVVSTILKRKYIGEYILNECGKPISKDKYFNISHCKDKVVLITSNVTIGIDIEHIRDVNKNLIEGISNIKEKEYIKDNKSFFEIWTNKEALMKCIGTGINKKPVDIPSLPINDIRIYNGNTYRNKTITIKDYVISVSRLSNEDYELEVVNTYLQ